MAFNPAPVPGLAFLNTFKQPQSSTAAASTWSSPPARDSAVFPSSRSPAPTWSQSFPSPPTASAWTEAFALYTPEEWTRSLLAAAGNACGGGPVKEREAVIDQVQYLISKGAAEKLFEVFLSAAPPGLARLIYKALAHPSSPAGLTYKVVCRLHAFHTASGIPPRLIPSREIDDATRAVAAVKSLEAAIRRAWPAVPDLEHRPEPPPAKVFAEGSIEEEEVVVAEPLFEVGVRMSQKQAKRMRKEARRGGGSGSGQNERLTGQEKESFYAYGVIPPRNVQEAWDVWNDGLERKWTESLEIFVTKAQSTDLVAYLIQKYFKPSAAQPLTPAIPSTSAAKSPDKSAIGSPDTDQVPSAYPSIQPRKAAALVSSVVNMAADNTFGSWRLFLSNKAISKLRLLRDAGKKFNIVIHKMQHLSMGHFSDDNSKVLAGMTKTLKGQTVVPIYEAKMARDMRLIWEVAVMADVVTGEDEQVIKVWDICNHRQIDQRLFSLLADESSRRDPEYRRRCVARSTPRDRKKAHDTVTTPLRWSAMAYKDERTDIPGVRGLTDEECLMLHANLALEKFVPYNQALVKSIMAADDLAVHAFALSAREQEVMLCKRSALVCGRSGTGKTTCILFKMLAAQLKARRAGDIQDLPGLRQIFTTQSAVLAARVSDYYDRLNLTHALDGLDAKSAKALAARKRALRQSQMLIDLDDEEAAMLGLPERFSELEDHHFPLFITFDALCCLLEADYDCVFSARAPTREQRRALRRYKIEAISDEGPEVNLALSANLEDDEETTNQRIQHIREEHRARLVTLPVWMNSYWPHFDQRLTKGFDPASVFGEILGIIRGSEAALETAKGYLSLHQYLNYSTRQQATFSASRERVYAIFKAYLRMKTERGSYDVAERTHTIVHAMRTAPHIQLGRVDTFFVDECQDNLISDMFLMKRLCQNPRGFLWAGDVAQQISSASGFRFQDLGAAFFRSEQNDPLVVMGKREPEQPEFFHLSTNYRSHGGIIGCAESIVSLIHTWFPESIDQLGKETGLVNGPKPVLFQGWSPENMEFEHFLFGERTEGSMIEFGADQVLLVRNDEARDALRQRVGDIGLILTINESKGLEFADVLLWDFFSDGVVSVQDWRLVLNGISTAAPHFNPDRHAVLNTELKSLYVAVTRARNHLWCFDRNPEAMGPMLQYWQHHQLISICRPDDPIPKMASSSKASDWEIVAKRMFDQKLFKHAASCYVRAGKQLQADISLAYNIRKKAREESHHPVTPGIGEQAFEDAAKRFRSVASVSNSTEATYYYRIAAGCFLNAGSHNLQHAAESFEAAQSYVQALQCWRKGGHFDSAIRVIEQHKSDIPKDVANSILDVCRIEYLRTEQYDAARKLFSDEQELCDFADDFIGDMSRLNLLERLGHYCDAGEIARQEGNIKDAISLFRRGGDQVRAINLLLDSLRTWYPLGGRRSSDDSKWMLQEIAMTTWEGLTDSQMLETAMFECIEAGNFDDLLQHAKSFEKKGDASASTLCLDYALAMSSHWQWLEDDETSRTALFDIITAYSSYSAAIRQLIDSDTNHDALASQVGIEVPTVGGTINDASELRIPIQSPLRRYVSDSVHNEKKSFGRLVLLRRDEKAAIVSAVQALSVAKLYLADRLQTRLLELHNGCRYRRSLLPYCPTAVIEGRCTKVRCEADHSTADINSARLSSKLRLLSHVYRTIYVVSHLQRHHRTNIDERKRITKYWDWVLYRVLYPPAARSGGLYALHVDFPEWDGFVRTLNYHTQSRLFELHPDRPEFLSEFNLLTLLASDLDGARWLSYYQKTTPCRTPRAQLSLLRESRPLAQDLMSFTAATLKGTVDYDEMWQGVMFWKHILDKQLQLDVMSTFPLLERLGSAIILSMCQYSHDGSGLHGLCLPRSYLVDVLAIPEIKGGGDLDLVKEFVELGCVLFKRIYVTHQSLFYGSAPLHTCPQATTAAYIARILRLLCAVGYNMRDDSIKNSIFAKIREAAAMNRPLHVAFRRYLQAQKVGSVITAYFGSGQHPMDTVIKLRHTTQRREIGVAGMVIQNFTSWVGLREKFLSRHSVVAPAGYVGQTPTDETGSETLSSAKKADVSCRSYVDAAESRQLPANEDDPSTMAEPEREGPALIAMTPSGNVRAVNVVDLSKEYDGRHIDAASVIRRMWRRRTARKNNADLGSADTRALQSVYLAYRQSSFCASASRPLRHAILGPLPHLAVVAETVVCVVGEYKKKLRVRLRKAQHQDIEKVQELITETNDLWRNTNNFAKQVSADRVENSIPDLVKLKQLARHVSDLYKSALEYMPGEQRLRDVQEHLTLGRRGLLQVAVVRPTPEKPKLPTLVLGGGVDEYDVDDETGDEEGVENVEAGAGRA